MARGATITIDGVEHSDIEFVRHSVRESFGEIIIGRLWASKELIDAAFSGATVTVDGEHVEITDVGEDEAVFMPVLWVHKRDADLKRPVC